MVDGFGTLYLGVNHSNILLLSASGAHVAANIFIQNNGFHPMQVMYALMPERRTDATDAFNELQLISGGSQIARNVRQGLSESRC